MARMPSLMFWSQRRTGVLALAKLPTDAGQVGIAWKIVAARAVQGGSPWNGWSAGAAGA
ncbi:hypothetical protein ACQKQD_11905 [Methylobacterium sp. NPDC080182]|uniref:hypothetical protein n=1 Tax=unclassified Methylobacterium TaxID=2615210 RepID=UPI0008A80A5B|nr:hypothetical protein [Methylobacterium sp. 275MFSha3.1]SEI15654.1 hypothetical protein SAMN02799636_06090 [Methylobacterium sp. 275MFSha3.1]